MTLGALQIFGWYGRSDAVPHARALAVDLRAAAADIGLDGDEPTGTELPVELRWSEREALKSPAETVEAIALVITVFLGTTSAEWVVERVLDELLNRTRSAWRRLLAPRGSLERPEAAVIQVYSRTESELVEVWLPLNTDAEADALLDVAAGAADTATERGDDAKAGRLLRYRIQRDLTIRVESEPLDDHRSR